MFKRLLCLVMCLVMLPAFSLATSVEDALIVGMISTRTMELTPLTPKERDIMSLYSLVYESLVTIDDNGIPQPLLAESWTETGGGKTWVFTLRENLTFSDGTPLTAHDVAASVQYILDLANNPEAEDTGFYANIKYIVSSFNARDDRTLEVKAKRAYYGLLYSLTFPVVPRGQVGMANPIGSGPYVVDAFEPAGYMMLSANTGWWQATPKVTSITVTFYTNTKDMINAYEYGRVDTVFTRSVAAAQYRSGNSSLSIKYSTRQLEVLMLNHRTNSFPLDSLNVRKAIRYAINKERISQSVYMGMTLDADTPYAADNWLYYDQESTYVYNPDKARELLAADGWEDLDGNGILNKIVDGESKNLRLSLFVYEDPENDVRYETANMISDMLLEVGIDAHVEPLPYKTVATTNENGETEKPRDAFDVLKAGSYDMFLCAFQMDAVPDYGFMLTTGNTHNFNRYSSKAMDDLIADLREREDQGGFAYASQAVQQQFTQDVPFIALFYRAGAILTRKMYTTVRSIREFELLRGIEAFGRQ